MLTYFIRMDKKDEWRWTVMETHGTDDSSWRTIGQSVQTYSTREACEKDVILMKTLSAEANIKN